MGHNQVPFIGYPNASLRPCYVPRFADPVEWDPTIAYEPLTIVLSEDGDSYTSKRGVPVGIDLSNSHYWARTGSYNATIGQYHEEVEQYHEEVEQYQEDVAQYQEDVAQYQEDVEQYHTDVNQYHTDVEQYQEDVEQYHTDVNQYHNNVEQYHTDVNQYHADVERYRGDVEQYQEDTDDAINDITGLIGSGFSTSNTIASNINRLGKIYDYFVTPEEYGAIGNGTTDDTAAFRQMFSRISNGTCILLKPNATYYITQTLNITKNQIGIFSISEFEYNPTIKFAPNIGIGINVTGFSLSLDSIQLVGNSANDETILLKFNRDNTTADGNIDSYIRNCAFNSSKSLIEIYGRNVKIHHNLFSLSNGYGITIAMTNNIVTGIRGIIISNNRFHGVRRCISNNVSNYSVEGCSIQITDNYVDGGWYFYNGASDNISIIGNYISRPDIDTTVIILFDKTINYNTAAVVSDNFLNGVQTYGSSYPRTFLGCTADVGGIIHVCNNVAITASSLADIFFIDKSSVDDPKMILNICNNTFINTTRRSNLLIGGASFNRYYGIIANNILNGIVSSVSTLTISNNVDIAAGL